MLKRILVVEDESAIRKLLRVNLTARGYEVVEVESAEDGWQTLQTEEIDAIVVDLLLPQMSGLDLLRLVEKDGDLAQTPVIILSALANGLAHEAEKHGNVVDTILKPMEISRLVDAVQRAVAG
ncbi:MAG: response regulator [Chloroflexi bacterium]|nr:response regulator [Chloroflexota bacterium]